MDNGLIPRRYAKALYKFASGHGSTDKVYEEMKEVIISFQKNPELQKALSNPYISNEDKAKLLKAAIGEKVENDYLGFIKLVLDQKREDYFYAMALSYRDIYRQEHKISQVKVTTATELSAPELGRLKNMVVKSFPDRTLEFSEVVDPDIIGGFIIDVDDSRMDASLSSELEQLRLNLIHN